MENPEPKFGKLSSWMDCIVSGSSSVVTGDPLANTIPVSPLS